MNVLIAANSSDNFIGAIEFLKGNTWTEKTVFKIVHVVEPSDVTDLWLSLSGATRHREILVERQLNAESLLKATREDCLAALRRESKLESNLEENLGANLEANLSTHVVIGRMNDVVVSTAREWQADLVVVGLPEATFIGRCTEGASFASVMADAPCPVTFARAPRAKAG